MKVIDKRYFDEYLKSETNPYITGVLYELIDDAPVYEVIQCKDCRFYAHSMCFHPDHNIAIGAYISRHFHVKSDFYCGDASKKQTDEKDGDV